MKSEFCEEAFLQSVHISTATAIELKVALKLLELVLNILLDSLIALM